MDVATAGLAIAGLALIVAVVQGAWTQRQLVRERRLGFELALLADLRRHLGSVGFQHSIGLVAALTRNGNAKDLLLLRAYMQVKETPQGRNLLFEVRQRFGASGELLDAEVLRLSQAEVEKAINDRIEEKRWW